jgi:hypothetical protein
MTVCLVVTLLSRINYTGITRISRKESHVGHAEIARESHENLMKTTRESCKNHTKITSESHVTIHPEIEPFHIM